MYNNTFQSWVQGMIKAAAEDEAAQDDGDETITLTKRELNKLINASRETLIDNDIIKGNGNDIRKYLGHAAAGAVLGGTLVPGVGALPGAVLGGHIGRRRVEAQQRQLVQDALDSGKLRVVDGKLELQP